MEKIGLLEREREGGGEVKEINRKKGKLPESTVMAKRIIGNLNILPNYLATPLDGGSHAALCTDSRLPGSYSFSSLFIYSGSLVGFRLFICCCCGFML